MPSIKDCFDLNEQNKLVLPDFQRSYVWDFDKQKSLLSSIFTLLPMGGILILKGELKEFAAKELCFFKELEIPDEDRSKECYFLLDGQQRLSTIKSTFSDFFNERESWRNIWDNLYPKLKTRWFIRVKPTNEEDDIFGWNNLKFKGLDNLEPDQVVDFLEVKNILKTKELDKWYHPGFSPKDDNGIPLEGNKLRNYIAKKASNDHLVPLYSIYQPPSSEKEVKPLHESVLQKLATERVEELQAEVRDGKKDIIELLYEVEEDIGDYYENNDENAIRNAWSMLAAKWCEKVNKYLVELIDQPISTIELPSDQISRAIAIFESINSNPTALDNFDIIVAKAARNSEGGSLSLKIHNELRKEIDISNGILDNIIGVKPSTWSPSVMGTLENNEISKTVKKQFLNLLSIFSHFTNGNDTLLKIDHIKKKKHLSLSHIQIQENTDIVLKALIRSFAFLQIRCGVIKLSALPYELMILPIAYALKDDNVWSNKFMIDKIEYWYWISIFSGRYRESQNQKCIKDICDLQDLIINGTNNFKSWYNNVLNEPSYSSKDVLLYKDPNHDIPSAVKISILQYIVSRQPYDFLPNGNRLFLNAWDIAKEKDVEVNGESFKLKVQDHHICPLYEVTKIGETTAKLRNEKHILNSPLNRTYISAYANSKISSKSPADYLTYVSNSSVRNHFLPTPFEERYKKKSEESEDQYYERILIERYNKFVDGIKDELDQLNPFSNH
ncbi:DUF262 domain-containing protein [Pseudoneobacillus rhizosphaerae]|uniref:GmrSD restriction endonucleases N-terminal domain-containing protein n=1 Tax=Pseudoneobacillus rhizosphaerae TaxID=2880968 RepID=A0A9C7LBY1_9BACI|nr:DUF262 domain-containing protein [Pseudoneobacillus rhizosphaerae]CAG9610636.1 hypothetical protein NEOCIP111885_04411 [Pseudoneobacillus rhizosphaerae]